MDAAAGATASVMPEAILLQDHEQLGARGTVVDVSKGYLRNYLIPRKIAAPATKGAIVAAAKRQEAAERALAQATAAARESAERAQPHRAHDPAPGGRRRAPVRLRHLAGHRRRDRGGPRHHHRPPQGPARGAIRTVGTRRSGSRSRPA